MIVELVGAVLLIIFAISVGTWALYDGWGYHKRYTVENLAITFMCYGIATIFIIAIFVALIEGGIIKIL